MTAHEIDYRIYGDTCEIRDVQGTFAGSFIVYTNDATKNGKIIIEDVHFQLLTDSYFHIKGIDSSEVRLNNIVIDSSGASGYGIYVNGGRVSLLAIKLILNNQKEQ